MGPSPAGSRRPLASLTALLINSRLPSGRYNQQFRLSRATEDSPHGCSRQRPPTGAPNSSSAVLVVVSGRQSGARGPLTGPLTLIGRAPDCEVRLNVKGVQPHHAMLVQGPDGFLLRNLTDQAVTVNGRGDHGTVRLTTAT